MSHIPGTRPVSLGDTADKLGKLEAEVARLNAKLEATQRVLGEALRVIVKASTIDDYKLRTGLDDMVKGWDGEDAGDLGDEASIFASELDNAIQR